MVFNSLFFLFFFSAFIIIYFSVKEKGKLLSILLASILFYFFFSVAGLLILTGVIVFNYFSGIIIEKAKNKERVLITSIVVNVGLLFLLKYFNFFNVSATSLLQSVHISNPIPILHIIAPVGISYYVLQAIGYNVDLYYEFQKAERNFVVFSTYFLFFPKIAQGPVERPRNLLPQLRNIPAFDYNRVKAGLILFAWGLFKKVVVADRLSILVHSVYDHPQEYTGLPLIAAGILYIFQLYADFSGYTDMALGCAQIMGFNLMLNFNRPFASTSVTDFWKRWHISFSSWLYEYIYNPISLSKRNWGVLGMCYAVMVTFLISGLWHGVTWISVIWGIINGIALSYEILTMKARKKFWNNFSPAISNFLCKAITFLFILISFMFVRANTVSDAGYIFSHLFDSAKSTSILNLGLDLTNVIIAISAILILILVEYYNGKATLSETVLSKSTTVRWTIYSIGILLILNLGMFNGNSFIYIQF